MAKKIPQLDDPTIPLTGNELMELSQSDVSVKVTVDQLDAYIASTDTHNALIGLQGGDSTSGEYYHLIAELYDQISSDPTTVIFSQDVTVGGTLELASGTSVNEFSVDGTLAGNSDTAVPTEKAAKTYVDTSIAGLTTNHNELLGLQGGDSTSGEYYHLIAELYNQISSDPTTVIFSQDVNVGSNLIVGGHSAMGVDGSVDGFGSDVLMIKETLNAALAIGIRVDVENEFSAGHFWGIDAHAESTPGSSSTGYATMIAIQAFANHATPNSTVDKLYGVSGDTSNSGNGSTYTDVVAGKFHAVTSSGYTGTSIISLAAGEFQLNPNAANAGAGLTIIDAYSLNVKAPGDPNATATNIYGLYIGDHSTTSFVNDYNIYSAGVNSSNKFEGNVTIDGVLTASSIVTDATTVIIGSTILSETFGGGLSIDGAEVLTGTDVGDVVGPGSSVDNAIALFDSTTGKLIKEGNLLATATGISIGNGSSVATIGYTADDLIISNTDVDGRVIIRAEEDGGGQHTLFDGDPDADVKLYYSNAVSVFTMSGGMKYGTDGYHQIYKSGNNFLFWNEVIDGDYLFIGKKTGGSNQNHCRMESNGGVTLYHIGSTRFVTTDPGATLTGELIANQVTGLNAPDAEGEAIRQTATVTEANLNELTDSTSETTLHYHAVSGGGPTQVINEIQTATGKTAATFVEDGASTLFYNEIKTLVSTAIGIEVWATATTYPTIDFFNSTGTVGGQIGYNAGTLYIQAGLSSNNVIVAGSTVKLYKANNRVFETQTEGFSLWPSSGNQPEIQFYHSDNSWAGKLLFIDEAFEVHQGYSGNKYIYGNMAGSLELYHNGTKTFETTAAGVSITDGSATAATIGFSADDLYISSHDADGRIYITAEKQAGGQSTMVVIDPDFAVKLSHGGLPYFETQAGGFNIGDLTGGANYTSFIQTTADLVITNKGNGGTIALKADQTGGSPVSLIVGDPDGAAELYFNAAKTVETTVDGALSIGVWAMAEIATPTPVADQGRIYTKTDNALYFQDGAGVEHEVGFAGGGQEAISSDSTSVIVTFGVAQSDTSYYPICTLENTTDGAPLFYEYIVTNKTTGGFTVELSGTVDSGNYKLNWKL